MIKIKWLLLVVSGIAVIGLAIYTVRSLREAAEETEASHRVLQAEINCNGQVENATDIVRQLDKDKDVPKKITVSKTHYNHKLNTCLVDVTRTEFGEGAKSTELVIDPTAKKALLWSIAGHGEDRTRVCFDGNAMPMDCGKADERHDAYLGE
jgi:hypothetical protein